MNGTISRTGFNRWGNSDAYERFIGRWSRLVAAKFVAWLGPEQGLRWLDVGCGTGALTAAVLKQVDPASILGVDTSAAFVETSRSGIDDSRATFEVGDAQALALEDGTFDVSVSGLCLNQLPDPPPAVAEMSRVTRPEGTVAAYVWDYAGGMEMLWRFWEAATRFDPGAKAFDQRTTNPICAPRPLKDLFTGAGLRDIAVEAIEIDTVFADFADYWMPFEGGAGNAPSYLKQVTPEVRGAIITELRAALPTAADGSITLPARAWAVRGSRRFLS